MNGNWTATCDTAELGHVSAELAKNPNDLGVGIIDRRTGQVRLFPYQDTDAFVQLNPQLQIMAGHEAAAAMAGIPIDEARGFILARQGHDWLLINQSHLNRADGQANSMQMDPQTVGDIVAALKGAGVPNPLIQ
jgi:hypothetical protein